MLDMTEKEKDIIIFCCSAIIKNPYDTEFYLSRAIQPGSSKFHEYLNCFYRVLSWATPVELKELAEMLLGNLKS